MGRGAIMRDQQLSSPFPFEMGEWLQERRTGGEFTREWRVQAEHDDAQADSAASSARSSASSEDEHSPPTPSREIPSCIRPGLFIGSIAAERDLNVLQALGITHVLQVGTSLRPRHWEDLKYGLVKAPDSRVFDIFHAIIKCNAFGFIDGARKVGGVLVHCAAGRSRSAAVVCAYLMHAEGLESEEAVADVCETHWICPNVGFKQQLQLFEDLQGDIARWPSPEDPTWPKKIQRRSAMEIDRPSMQELRSTRRQQSAEPDQASSVAKSAQAPELPAPVLEEPVLPAPERVHSVAPSQTSSAKLAPAPVLAELVLPGEQVLLKPAAAAPAQAFPARSAPLLHAAPAAQLQKLAVEQAAAPSQAPAAKPVLALAPEQAVHSQPAAPARKPEQASKWLAFQQRVSEQAALEKATLAKPKKVPTPAQRAVSPARTPCAPRQEPRRAPSPARSASTPPQRPPARRTRRVRPQAPANSVFLPPGLWEQSVKAREPDWDLRKALEAAGVPIQEKAESTPMTRRYSFDNSAPPAPALVKVF